MGETGNYGNDKGGLLGLFYDITNEGKLSEKKSSYTINMYLGK